MRQDFTTFIPQFTLVIAGNHKPSLRNIDEATRRRFNLIPFGMTIKDDQRDPDLEATLKGEWPGILAWMIAGCLDYQREGLSPPAVINEATTAYLKEEDALARFIDECCEKTLTDFTLTTALFSTWRQWCEGTGDFSGTLKNFSRKFEARGFERGKDPKTRQSGFRGVKFRR